MPLLSKLLDNRSMATNSSKINIRYCDSEVHRHHVSNGTFCSFAAPEITALVPQEQRHTRLREGGECSHFTIGAIQTACLRLRLMKRFESIENDRQEHMVDILNDMNNRLKETDSAVKSVSENVSQTGPICTLLQRICDIFKQTFITEPPQMEELAKNTSYMVDHSANSVLEMRDMRKALTSVGEVIRQSVDKLIAQTNELQDKHFSEISSLKFESQLVSASLERLEASTQMNGLDMKQEMTELRHQMIQMKEEIRSLKEAIIEDLPNRLADALHPMSDLGSDISVVNDEKEDEEAEEENNEDEEIEKGDITKIVEKNDEDDYESTDPESDEDTDGSEESDDSEEM